MVSEDQETKGPNLFLLHKFYGRKMYHLVPEDQRTKIIYTKLLKKKVNLLVSEDQETRGPNLFLFHKF